MNLKLMICLALATTVGSDALHAQSSRDSQSRRRVQRDARNAASVPPEASSSNGASDSASTQSAKSAAADVAAAASTGSELEAIKSAVRTAQLDENAEVAAGFALELPSPAYDFDGSNLTWRQPGDLDTHYLMITLQDCVSSHTLPGSKVIATITDGSGKDAASSVTLSEVWDKRFRHYGVNLNLPATLTTGTLSVTIDPPNWKRRGHSDGAFFVKQTSFKFPNVDFTTGTLTRFEPEEASRSSEKITWPKGRRAFAEPTPYPGSQRQ